MPRILALKRLRRISLIIAHDPRAILFGSALYWPNLLRCPHG
jgi:hypothetical protein